MILRTIDSMGRIAIPKEFRRKLQLKEDTLLNLDFDEKTQSVVISRTYTIENEINAAEMIKQFNNLSQEEKDIFFASVR